MINRPGLPKWFERFLQSQFLKIELISVLAAIFGLIGFYDQVLLVSLTSLAVLYFISGLIKYPKLTFFDHLTRQALHISWSVQVMGIMFWSLDLPGKNEQLTIGVFAGLIVVIAMAIQAMIKSDYSQFAQKVLMLRTMILSGITITILLTMEV